LKRLLLHVCTGVKSNMLPYRLPTQALTRSWSRCGRLGLLGLLAQLGRHAKQPFSPGLGTNVVKVIVACERPRRGRRDVDDRWRGVIAGANHPAIHVSESLDTGLAILRVRGALLGKILKRNPLRGSIKARISQSTPGSDTCRAWLCWVLNNFINCFDTLDRLFLTERTQLGVTLRPTARVY
jgi:hypothetical protein